MACPGGCLNGGGQIKPKDMNLNPKETLEALEISFQSMDEKLLLPNPEDNKSIVQLMKLMTMAYNDWSDTSFKAIQKEQTHNLKW